MIIIFLATRNSGGKLNNIVGHSFISFFIFIINIFDILSTLVSEDDRNLYEDKYGVQLTNCGYDKLVIQPVQRAVVARQRL